MGLFRRRSQKDDQFRSGPEIEEVDAADRTPQSTSEPTVEEPDETGSYPSERRRPHQQDSYLRRPHSQDELLRYHDMMPGFGGPMPGFGFGGPMSGFAGPMPGFGGPMGGMDMFHSSFFGGMDPFSMHGPSHMGSFFEDDFFGRPSMQGGPQSRHLPQLAPDLRAGPSGQNPGHFQYQFQSWESTMDGSGKARQRHVAARGSSDDQKHHLKESIRNENGQVRTRQETIPFEGRPNKMPAIADR